MPGLRVQARNRRSRDYRMEVAVPLQVSGRKLSRGRGPCGAKQSQREHTHGESCERIPEIARHNCSKGAPSEMPMKRRYEMVRADPSRDWVITIVVTGAQYAADNLNGSLPAPGTQRRVDHLLCFTDDRTQMGLALEALGVNFVNVFRAGRTGCKPATLCNNLQSADGSLVSGRFRQLGADRLACQLRLLHGVRRQTLQLCFLFRRGRRV